MVAHEDLVEALVASQGWSWAEVAATPAWLAWRIWRSIHEQPEEAADDHGH